MSKRIHLGQVPKYQNGLIAYDAIPSVPVRIMVAEEELSNLNRQMKRHANRGDSFQCDMIKYKERHRFLMKCLSLWKDP